MHNLTYAYTRMFCVCVCVCVAVYSSRVRICLRAIAFQAQHCHTECLDNTYSLSACSLCLFAQMRSLLKLSTFLRAIIETDSCI